MNDDTSSKNSEQDLYEHFRLNVEKGKVPERIDKYILNRIENISRNKIQVAAKDGFLKVNGEPVRTNYKVRPLDLITFELPNPIQKFKIIPEKI